MIKPNYILAQCFLVCLFLSNNAFALLSDSKAPIEIKAKTVIVDERRGLSIYTGDVKLTQGSLSLSAENVEIFSTQNKVTKVIAKGSSKQRAHYQQNQQNKSGLITADAENIIYSLQQETIHLKGNAHLVRSFDSFGAHTLDYDIKNDKIMAKQSKDAAERVRFKIKL